IGANTALFSILNGLLLKTLPVRAPAELAVLKDGSWSYPIWEQVKAKAPEAFEGAFAWSPDRFDLSKGGPTDLVGGAYASASMFSVLGVPASRGRTLSEADDVRGGGPNGPVAVISDRLWRQHFNGADDVVGRTLTLQRV